MEFLRTLIIFILIFFTLWTIFIIVKTLITFKDGHRLFKSSFNSTWKTLTSSILMIGFFGISFSIIAGTASVINRLESSLNGLISDNNMHMAFGNLQNIDANFSTRRIEDYLLEKKEERMSTPEDIAIEEYFYEYFGKNSDIFTYFLFLNAEKLLSTVSFGDIFTNINWKYNLSWYMSSESVDWGFQYFALNDLKILEMIKDYTSGSSQALANYFVSDYRDVTLTQGNYLMDTQSENIYINDFATHQSNKEVVNQLLTLKNDDTYDVRVGVGEDWANYNNVKVGDIINLPQPNGKDFRAKIMFTFRVPQYIFPSFSLSKVIPDSKTQTYVVMNSIDYLKYFSDVSGNKIYFGFNDLYNDIDNYDDYTSRYIKNRLREYLSFVNRNSILAFNNFNAQLFDNLTNYDAISVSIVYLQINIMKLLTILLLVIFLTITILVLAVLVKKKVKNNRPELGTLKALGWSQGKISLSLISFPLIIILIGGVIAIAFGFLVQQLWINLWASHFLIDFGGMLFSISELTLVFVLPTIILISISYLVTYRILRKPTMDLIHNVGEYKPNIFVKISSIITRKNKNFYVSYQIKNIFRSIGKSSIIFSSIFFAFFSVSIALAGINVINKSSTSIVNTLKMDSVIIMNGTENSISVNQDETNMEAKYLNHYLFSDLVNWNELKNLTTEEQVWNLAKRKYKFTKVNQLERAQELDEQLSGYINTTNFNNENWVIPWQAFEFLNYGLLEVEAGEASPVNWEDIRLNYTNITFNNYLTIYNQYATYYNYNQRFKSDKETIIRPDLLINTVIYDNNNLLPYYYDFANWETFIDEFTNERINSLFDLDYHRINKEEKYLTMDLNGDQIFVNENGVPITQSGAKNVQQWIEKHKEIDSEIDNLVTSYWEVEDSIPYSELENGKTIFTTTLCKYEINSYKTSKNFNTQWFSIMDNGDNLTKAFGLNSNLTNQIDKFEPKQVEVKYQNKFSGEINVKNVDVIPIVIDSINAQRLNLKAGDIIKTGFYDQQEQLNNFLELNSVNNSGIAFEIVDVFENNLPLGIFTTKPYIDSYVNNLRLDVIMQINQTQRQYYSLLSNNFRSGTTLEDDFQTNIRTQIENIITKKGIEKQLKIITNILQNIFILFSFFAILIALTLIVISIKEIADNSNHEVSILKANGLSNKRASRLILIPYIIIMILAILLVIPIIIIIFAIINGLIFEVTRGMNFNIGVLWWQWLILCFMIILAFLITIILIRISFSRQATIKNL